jgi:ergothioneine biosynthesis protein EgtB
VEPALASRYRDVRAATERLCEPLSAEDCAIQSMPDASPAKWHLAHTSWFFETFVLEDAIRGYRPFHADFRFLFNSYYNSVGEQYPRPERGMISRPSLEEVLAYRAHVDERMLDLLARSPGARLASVVEVGLQHEQQHQELILTDVKHLLSRNPLHPVYRDAPALARAAAPPLRWLAYSEGVREIGHDGVGFSFDNERPGHRALVGAFELASRPVTNGEFLEFVRDGGYEQPEHWLSDGWAKVRGDGWRAPLYWEERDGEWLQMTLSGLREVRAEEPVVHVSYYEADAFASWAGARLPSEEEWETAAGPLPIEGNFAESGLLHPAALRTSNGGGPSQMFGDVWEWTRSAYAPYPGYRQPPGAFGEYNAKFMCNQLVLRGGSCATPISHIRPTYRNFFFADSRWQFSGIRLARDAG